MSSAEISEHKVRMHVSNTNTVWNMAGWTVLKVDRTQTFEGYVVLCGPST